MKVWPPGALLAVRFLTRIMADQPWRSVAWLVKDHSGLDREHFR